jgi:glycosyltransferase involved in cell wall biosynthesis
MTPRDARALRIGVNALYLLPGVVGGTEIYLRSLLRALAEIDASNQYLVFTNRETASDLVPSAPNFLMMPQRVRASHRPARILWEQAVLPSAAARARVDVLFNPGFTAPLATRIPQVTVFHDLQHVRHPEHFRRFDLLFWRLLLYGSAHRSRLILADSEATAADVRRHYRLPDARVRVVPLGVDPAFFELAARRAPEPFLLTVSTLHPQKNLDRLLHAFAAFHRKRPEFRLVICGVHGLAAQDLHALRRTLGLDEAVDFPGWIPREDLYDLYRRAWACVLPSTFEGFGLPLLEALAAGVPTACSDIEPLRSMAGDAAVRFDPLDAAALTAAMRRFSDDSPLRARLTAAGLQRAAAFSWRATAEGTLYAMRAAARPE